MATTTGGAGITRVLSLLAIFSLLLACAPKVYISTIGQSGDVGSVCLKRLGKSTNPLMDSFVEGVIKRSLEERNMRVTDTCEDYTLEYDYGVTPRQMYVPRIVYGGPEVMTFLAYRLEEGRAVPEIYTVIPPPATYYYTDVETVYVHWITLKLNRGNQPLWIGEASAEDYTPDIRSRIDALVRKLLEYLRIWA